MLNTEHSIGTVIRLDKIPGAEVVENSEDGVLVKVTEYALQAKSQGMWRTRVTHPSLGVIKSEIAKRPGKELRVLTVSCNAAIVSTSEIPSSGNRASVHLRVTEALVRSAPVVKWRKRKIMAS